MPTNLEKLQDFVNFCRQHIKGDEKGESQAFLRVAKGSKKDKRGFADLVWKPRVLVEIKKRGEDLGKHYSQAESYWMRLVPNRPRYVILCNFDEFQIFDFENQVDTPVATIPLEQLPERSGAFTFMESDNRTPVFRNNQVIVTDRTTLLVSELYQLIVERGKRTDFKDFEQCHLGN